MSQEQNNSGCGVVVLLAIILGLAAWGAIGTTVVLDDYETPTSQQQR